MSLFAATLPLSDVESLDPLRLAPDVRVGISGETVWLCWGALSDEWREALESCPFSNRFQVAEGRLTRVGEMLPFDRLPDCGWQTLADWLEPTLPTALGVGFSPAAAELQLVRDPRERLPEAIILSQAQLQEWVDTVSALRLKPLLHAVSAAGEVFVTGSPLPSVPSFRYWVEDGIALPLGYRLEPALPAAVVRQLLQLPHHTGSGLSDVAIFHLDGSWQRICVDDLHPLTRSGIRMADYS